MSILKPSEVRGSRDAEVARQTTVMRDRINASLQSGADDTGVYRVRYGNWIPFAEVIEAVTAECRDAGWKVTGDAFGLYLEDKRDNGQCSYCGSPRNSYHCQASHS